MFHKFVRWLQLDLINRKDPTWKSLHGSPRATDSSHVGWTNNSIVGYINWGGQLLNSVFKCQGRFFFLSFSSWSFRTKTISGAKTETRAFSIRKHSFRVPVWSSLWRRPDSVTRNARQSPQLCAVVRQREGASLFNKAWWVEIDNRGDGAGRLISWLSGCESSLSESCYCCGFQLAPAFEANKWLWRLASRCCSILDEQSELSAFALDGEKKDICQFSFFVVVFCHWPAQVKISAVPIYHN